MRLKAPLGALPSRLLPAKRARPSTTRITLPASPCPKVLAPSCDPLSTSREPAVICTSPPRPKPLGAMRLKAPLTLMPSGLVPAKRARPSITRITLPDTPCPKVKMPVPSTAPSSTSREPAVICTSPPVPTPLGAMALKAPLALPSMGLVPSKWARPSTTRITLPASPCPKVLASSWAPLSTSRVPAVICTSPPVPTPSGAMLLKAPLGLPLMELLPSKRARPSMLSATLPPWPVPNTAALICAPLSTSKLAELMRTSPPVPSPPESMFAKAPVRRLPSVPSKRTVPSALTTTSPTTPNPVVSIKLLITDTSLRASRYTAPPCPPKANTPLAKRPKPKTPSPVMEILPSSSGLG